MLKVLFVCLGNICRSPLAEGIFRDKAEKAGLKGSFFIDSAGTASYHIGSLADHRTRQVALARGIELTHKARALRTEDFSDFDLIIPMDDSNMRNALQLQAESGRAKLYLMREFDAVGKGQAVPDPYDGEIKDFEQVHDILERSCDGLLTYCRNILK